MVEEAKTSYCIIS